MIVDNVAKLLNEALTLDPAAVNQLFSLRRQCSAQLADHPSIVVGAQPGDPPRYWLSLLGLINGILIDQGSPDLVVAIQDDQQNVLEFGVKAYEP